MHSEHFGAFVSLAWGLMWFVFWGLLVFQRGRERARIYAIVEKAAAEGRPVPPEILARLTRGQAAISDLRAGLFWLAVGVGLAIAGVINYFQYKIHHPDSQLFYGPFGLFPIPLLVGVAFLILAWLRRGQQA
jgi:hypothetical protein